MAETGFQMLFSLRCVAFYRNKEAISEGKVCFIDNLEEYHSVIEIPLLKNAVFNENMN